MSRECDSSNTSAKKEMIAQEKKMFHHQAVSNRIHGGPAVKNRKSPTPSLNKLPSPRGTLIMVLREGGGTGTALSPAKCPNRKTR